MSTPSSNGTEAEIFLDCRGGTADDWDITLNNTLGLRVQNSLAGHFNIQKVNNKLGINISDGTNFGTGYTGTINGARFVNGICVGQA